MLKDVLERENVRSGAVWRRVSPLFYPAYCILAVAYVGVQLSHGGWAAILPPAFALLPVVMWLPVRLGVYGDKYRGRNPENALGQYIASVAMTTLGCFNVYAHGLSWNFGEGTWMLVVGLVYFVLSWLPKASDRPDNEMPKL